MTDFPPLESLGKRIMVCGPSASGKSTLATALGRRLALPVTHLDALRFIAGSEWIERPNEEFALDAAAAAEPETWVIEGNYFSFIAPRLARATGIVCLGGTRLANYWSYLRRSLADPVRIGGLPGASERINWTMSRWILFDEPRRRSMKLQRLRDANLPLVYVPSRRELHLLYAAWGLTHV